MSNDDSTKAEAAKPAKATAARPEIGVPGPDGSAACPCGKTHKLDPAATRAVNASGPDLVIHGPEGSYRVPRVFAANHDVTAQHLRDAADKYGFEPAERQAAR
jgi:hypothetical protein